jgi:hypothetical protein
MNHTSRCIFLAPTITQNEMEFDGVPFQGATFRLFNPKTMLWSLYWADSNVVVMDVPQVGSFDGDIGRFYAKDVFEEKPIIVVFQWDKTNPDSPIWSQAFSPDNGATWEWNWYVTLPPAKARRLSLLLANRISPTRKGGLARAVLE